MKIGIEEWRSIPGVDARYKVNREGVVLSVKGEPLAANVQKRGYRAVQVLVDGVFRTRTVHSLVADAFLGKRPEHLHVNHKDGNKLNNHVDNLEYVTLKENVFHALATGLAHRSMIAMVGVCKDTGKGIWLRSQGEGRALGFHPSHIRECANGSRATHKNHTWSYA